LISVLCVMKKSNYELIPKLDLWGESRDAYFFTGSNPIITHAPCQQWSRMKGFANHNPDEKKLAFHCLKLVLRNGGIFEHPAGSSFFKEAGITKNIYSVDQSWWGFKARKRTYLLFHKIKPLSFPLNFSPPTHVVSQGLKINGSGKPRKGYNFLPDLKKSERSKMTLSFCQWLVDCVDQSDLCR